MENQTNTGGYGKRPLWQWILLYVIIAAVAYGLIYYFVVARGSGNTNTPYMAPVQNQQAQSGTNQPAAPVQQAGQTNPAAPVTAPAATPAPTSASAAPAPKSFSVNGNDASASLTTITVAKGTPVSITFGADAQNTYHGGLDFRSSVVSTGPIAPGSTKTVSFTASQSFAFTPYWPSTNIAKPYTINIVVQ